MATSFNPKLSEKTQSAEKSWSQKTGDEKWNDVTTHRAWRHTIGRISCAARIPIYVIGTVLQGAKTVIKAIVSPLVSFGRWATGSKKLESWSFSGVARDAIMVGALTDRTLNSALCVLCAPPKQYRSLLDVLIDHGGLIDIVIMGAQHKELKTEGVPMAPGDLFKGIVHTRAQYHKQIIQCNSIWNDNVLTEKAKARIKAG